MNLKYHKTLILLYSINLIEKFRFQNLSLISHIKKSEDILNYFIKFTSILKKLHILKLIQ